MCFYPANPGQAQGITFERLLTTLSERDRRIVALYAFGHTQEEIGAIVGLSQRHIGRVLEKMSKTYAETR